MQQKNTIQNYFTMIQITQVGNMLRFNNTDTEKFTDTPVSSVMLTRKVRDGANDLITVEGNDYHESFEFSDVAIPATANSAALINSLNALL